MDTLVNPVAVTVQGNSILMTLVTRPSRPDVSYASLPTPSTPFIIPAFAGMMGNRQPCHLIARVRPARRIAQVEALLDEFGQAAAQGQGGRQDQSGIGHQAAVVEGDLDPVGVVRGSIYRMLLVLGSVCGYKTIIPEAQEHLLAASGR